MLNIKKVVSLFNKINILNNKKNENDKKEEYKKEEYNVDNLKLDLDEKDLEEFKQFAPTLLIYKGEKYIPLKMNFDNDWDLKNNAQNFKKFIENQDNYDLKDLFEKYSTVYVNKIKEVKVNNEKYSVYQYWFYWPYNSFIFDWHDHDFELIEVYVNPKKEVKYIVCSYHNFKKICFVNQGYSVKDFVIKVEPNSHGMSFNEGGSILLVPNILKPLLKPYFKYTPTRFIPLVSSNNNDSPFYFDKNKKIIIDNRGLIDKKGFLKNRGVPYNWFIKVVPPFLRKYFYTGILNNK
jgi:hypothetical protein